MYMGPAAHSFKKPGDENFVRVKNDAADRADPVAVSAKTVNTAAYMHETVFAPVQGGEGMGTNKFSIIQFCRTYGAGLGLTGHTFSPGPGVMAAPQPDSSSKERYTHSYKKGIPKP